MWQLPSCMFTCASSLRVQTLARGSQFTSNLCEQIRALTPRGNGTLPGSPVYVVVIVVVAAVVVVLVVVAVVLLVVVVVIVVFVSYVCCGTAAVDAFNLLSALAVLLFYALVAFGQKYADMTST